MNDEQALAMAAALMINHDDNLLECLDKYKLINTDFDYSMDFEEDPKFVKFLNQNNGKWVKINVSSYQRAIDKEEFALQNALQSIINGLLLE